MINIIFDDKVDFYFARERVSERLALASTFLPPGVVPYLAPDATALGQIFWYTVEGEGQDLGRLRAIQDWNVRYQLNSVPGVAQVASVGGYPIEYQIDVDPEQAAGLRHHARRTLLGRRAVEFGRRRPRDPQGQRRISGPRRRLDHVEARHRTDRHQNRGRHRHADHRRRIWPPSASARNSAAACWRKTATKRSAAW